MPFYALVDADPHGVAIYLTYKFGSQVNKTFIMVDVCIVSTSDAFLANQRILIYQINLQSRLANESSC